ncbi:MAG: hypothetical protein C3F08_03460 [Candidatus Methylomirabilota bacterium]|nr:MAG: hypothetical protein C3F08_03460 [candidate division NC10 bacterium]
MAFGGADRRVRFIVGVAFIAVSLLVYPAYLVIAFLPFSGTIKLRIALLASLLSWGLFGAGLCLSGREGYEWLKRRLRG